MYIRINPFLTEAAFVHSAKLSNPCYIGIFGKAPVEYFQMCIDVPGCLMAHCNNVLCYEILVQPMCETGYEVSCYGMLIYKGRSREEFHVIDPFPDNIRVMQSVYDQCV